MRRLLVVIAFVLVACGDAGPAAPVPPPVAGPASTSTSVDPATSPSPAVAPVTAVPPGAEPAPDFALELASGDLFVLSAEARPVYLVFWAEW